MRPAPLAALILLLTRVRLGGRAAAAATGPNNHPPTTLGETVEYYPLRQAMTHQGEKRDSDDGETVCLGECQHRSSAGGVSAGRAWPQAVAAGMAGLGVMGLALL